MPLPLRMSYNEEITTISLTRPCERSEAIQYHLLVIANVVKQSSITYSSLRTQWSNPVSPTRHCERSEAIQRISELDYKWIATASPRDDQLLLNHLRTPFHSWEFTQTVCGHHFTAENLLKLCADTISQLRICSNRLRTPFHSWEFAQTVCGHHFTVGNSAKLSYFHPKIIFYSLIKKENDKHNKT